MASSSNIGTKLRERRFGGRALWSPLFLKNSNSNFYGSKNSEKNMRVCKDVTHMCVKIHDEIPWVATLTKRQFHALCGWLVSCVKQPHIFLLAQPSFQCILNWKFTHMCIMPSCISVIFFRIFWDVNIQISMKFQIWIWRPHWSPSSKRDFRKITKCQILFSHLSI